MKSLPKQVDGIARKQASYLQTSTEAHAAAVSESQRWALETAKTVTLTCTVLLLATCVHLSRRHGLQMDRAYMYL